MPLDPAAQHMVVGLEQNTAMDGSGVIGAPLPPVQHPIEVMKPVQMPQHSPRQANQIFNKNKAYNPRFLYDYLFITMTEAQF